MNRFVVCGEALIDLAFGTEDSTFASSWTAMSAGGPMNTAIGLARLGESVEFCGRLSTDRFGEQLARHLAANQVGLSLGTRTPDPTSLAVVSLDAERKASYTFHFSGTSNFGWVAPELPEPGSDWLHVGSLTAVVEPGASIVRAWASAHRGPMSMDINVRPSVIGDPVAYWRAVEPWLRVVGEHSGVVKASDDDIEFLARGSASESLMAGATGMAGATEVMRRWQEVHGFEIGVITLGAAGAAAVAADGAIVTVPGRAVSVIDTVGAGDTFMAGFLAAHAGGASLESSLGQGVAAAALVCGRQGPQPPTRNELEAFLASGAR